MQRSGKIVVGFDGSEPAADALEWALHLAEATGRPIQSTTVWNLPLDAATKEGALGSPDLSASYRAARAEAELIASRARHIAHRLGFPSYRFMTSVLAGDAVSILLQQAQGASLLVVGSRGRTASKQLLLGSVARRCVHAASGPVAIIPPGTEPPQWRRMPIVVGVDDSPGTDRALRWAAEVADRTGAALRLVAAYGTRHQLPDAVNPWAGKSRNSKRSPGAVHVPTRISSAWARRSEAEIAIEQARATISETTATVATLYEVVEGDPRDVLHDAGRYASVVVVADRDQGVLKRLIAGSIIDKLVTHPLGPIVVVPAEESPTREGASKRGRRLVRRQHGRSYHTAGSGISRKKIYGQIAVADSDRPQNRQGVTDEQPCTDRSS